MPGRVPFSPMVVIGSPFDQGGFRLGARLGPAAVRLAGLKRTFEALEIPVVDVGDLPFIDGEKGSGLNYFEGCLQNLIRLRDATLDAIGQGKIPCAIGGDHSMSMGSVAAARHVYGDDLAVLWVDAHADSDTPATTPSRNLHGMSVAALIGLPSGVEGKMQEQWDQLQNELMGGQFLNPANMAWLGLREVDEGERNVVGEAREQGAFVSTMYDLDRTSMPAMVDRFTAWLRERGATRLWISFDVDSLDPILAPGTGTTVHGGLTYREMHVMGEILYEELTKGNCQLAGLDVVEINPLFDHNNAQLVVQRCIPPTKRGPTLKDGVPFANKRMRCLEFACVVQT